ncbi:heterokaryon incompatibility protein-domain-containing protein, partial [Colletotrichum godetiae]
WIDNCKEDHDSVCNRIENREVLAVPGMKLIDCETLHIKPAHESMPWVALSYVWDQTITLSHQRGGPLIWGNTSASVKDAITVTRGLGYRYLWIDKYCIDQEDEREIEDQIRRMDLIYSNAEITIVAAAGLNETYGLPGVGLADRLKQDVLRLGDITVINTGPHPACYVELTSRWSTRGWTFQEGLLSQRRIIFTEYQTFFEC